MTEGRRDFLEWQRDMASKVEDSGFTETDYREQIRKLRILGFHIDRKGENIVSEIDGTIVFVDRKYSGEKVMVGDVWLCSAVMVGMVYYAMPLKKITSSMIMGLSDDIRDGIIDALWKSNRAEFVKIFEQRYKEDVYQQAYNQAKEESQAIIAGLEDKVSSLSKQVEHSRMILGSQESPEDYIVLGSEEDAELENVTTQVVPVYEPASVQMPREDFNPVIGRRSMVSAPGMPEVRVADQLPWRVPTQRYVVERLAEETIYSESFIDGKYFVHINPSKRFIVVRKHDYGSAICINRRIRLDGLGAYSNFGGRCQLMAEYSARYDGMLIYL